MTARSESTAKCTSAHDQKMHMQASVPSLLFSDLIKNPPIIK